MSQPGGFNRLLTALQGEGVRFVVIGVWGVNYWARSAGTVFATQDRDLFLPTDPDNEWKAWRACEAAGLELWCGGEPLDMPRDRVLAEQVVSRHALVRASAPGGLDVDLTLVMAGFDFESVWKERRIFRVEGIDVPVARLTHIVKSKAEAGRPKDRLFLATHEAALREMLGTDEPSR